MLCTLLPVFSLILSVVSSLTLPQLVPGTANQTLTSLSQSFDNASSADLVLGGIQTTCGSAEVYRDLTQDSCGDLLEFLEKGSEQDTFAQRKSPVPHNVNLPKRIQSC